MRNFAFTEDQRALQAGVREFLDGRCTPDDVRTAAETGSHSPERWKALAELGVVGATVPAEHGGLGLTPLDLVLLLEEAGRAGLPEPLLETTAVAAPLLAEAGRGDWLAAIAAGDARVVVATDTLVPHGDVADAFVTGSGLTPADAASWTLNPSVDPTRPLGPLSVQRAEPLDLPDGAFAAARDRGTVGAAAMLIGAAARMLDLAVTHATHREQFGAPIGSFQAVKHLLADALVAIDLARPTVYRAAYELAHATPTTGRDASMAKLYATRAATVTAKAALQTHGAIGYTREHDLHLWMAKSWALAAAYGTEDEHRERVKAAVLAGRRSDVP